MSIKRYVKRIGRYLLTGLPEQHIAVNIVTLAPNELLNGRRALITGGTSGIGYAIANSFLSSGASVIITGRNMDRLKKACQSLAMLHPEKEKNISYLKLDNRNIISFKTIFNQNPHLRHIDILVNNAGIIGGDLTISSEDNYDAVLDTNLKSAFFLTKIISSNMKESGIRGNILNIASSSSLRPATNAYTLSKWGIRGLTLGMAKALAPYGITVNGLAPGPTATPMLINDERNFSMTLEKSPIGRYIMPEEIANMAVILVSEMGRSIIGDIVYMTGGAGVVTFDDIKYDF